MAGGGGGAGIGALMIRTGFWGISHNNYDKEHQDRTAEYLGLYSMSSNLSGLKCASQTLDRCRTHSIRTEPIETLTEEVYSQ